MYAIVSALNARVAELVDAKDLKSGVPDAMGGSKNVDIKPFI